MTAQRQTGLIARVVPDAPPDSGRRAPRTVRARAARALSVAATVALLGMIAVFGFGPGTSQPAQAASVTCPMSWETAPFAESVKGGVRALMKNAVLDEKPYGDTRPHTGYDRFGTSGAYWSTYFPKDDDKAGDRRGGCWKMLAQTANYLANQVFGFSKSITGLSIATYEWASDPDLLSEFEEPMDCLVTGCNGGKGLKDTLYLNFLQPVIMFGGLWAGWVGLMKKRTTEAAQGAVWMFCAATFALIFMAHPSLIAAKANAMVSTVNATVMDAVTAASARDLGEQDLCAIDLANDRAEGKRKASCSIYKALVFTPWAAGQFGVGVDEPLPNNTVPEDLRVTWNGRVVKDLRVTQLEAHALSHDEALAVGNGRLEDTLALDAERWEAVREEVRENHPDLFGMWTGDSPGERINIAFAAVIASLFAGLLVLVISFATVVMAIGMILLIMMAPLFLLIGAHPGFGRGIALKWLELLIGTLAKRIVLGFMLAILIGMYQVILQLPMPWFSQIALIVAVGVGAIMFRKPMLDTLNVINLGGSRTGLEQANLSRQGKKGSAMGIGAVSGGLTGARTGGAGAFLGGLVAGGMMGARSGNPMRAATMGAGAGRRVGGRKRTAAEKAEKARLKAAKEAEETSEETPEESEAPTSDNTPAPDREGGPVPQPAPDFDGTEDWGAAPPGGGPRGAGAGGAVPRPHTGEGAGGRRSTEQTLHDIDTVLGEPTAAPVTAGGGGSVPRPQQPVVTASATGEATRAAENLLHDIEGVLGERLDGIEDGVQQMGDGMADMSRDMTYLGTDMGHTLDAVEESKVSLSQQMLESLKQTRPGGSTPPSGGGTGGAGPRPGGA